MTRTPHSDVLAASEVLLYGGSDTATIQAFLGRDYARREYVAWLIYGGSDGQRRRQDLYRGQSGLAAAAAANRTLAEKQHLGYRTASNRFAEFPDDEVRDAIRRASGRSLSHEGG
jgi:hypothetical protein